MTGDSADYSVWRSSFIVSSLLALRPVVRL